VDEMQRGTQRVLRSVRAIERGRRDGNPQQLLRAVEELPPRAEALAETATRLRAAARAWQEGWQGGPPTEAAYAAAFEAACRAEGLPLEGAFPGYVVFPLEMRFALRDMAVTINRRRVQVLRPAALAHLLRQQRDHLERSAFDAARLRQALLRAHELLSGGNPTHGVSLREVRRLLALREGTGSAGYTLRMFAYDLYRLRQAGLEEVEAATLNTARTAPIR
jgi:hypothetical protein